jgi:hypothetical protein
LETGLAEATDPATAEAILLEDMAVVAMAVVVVATATRAAMEIREGATAVEARAATEAVQAWAAMVAQE